MRRNLINIGFLTLIILIGECITDTEAHIPLPFLRGGSSTAVATRTRTKYRQQRRHRKNAIPKRLANLQQGIHKVGEIIQKDATKQWKGLRSNAGREWGKFVAHIPRLPSKKLHSKSSKLDEVLRTFSTVHNGRDVDTAQLLKACRAHLAFMKSGGSALRLVAKDLESNLHKAEALFKKSPKECRRLTSLLETEQGSGIHNGNILRDPSAAMGLLWIRRSLAFQSDLYGSLTHGQQHPRDAAMDAYSKHLFPYHGWALRKVFPASLSQMPEREAFIATVGGIKKDELIEEYEREIVKKLKTLVATWDPLLDAWKGEFERLGLEDTRRV